MSALAAIGILNTIKTDVARVSAELLKVAKEYDKKAKDAEGDLKEAEKKSPAEVAKQKKLIVKLADAAEKVRDNYDDMQEAGNQLNRLVFSPLAAMEKQQADLKKLIQSLVMMASQEGGRERSGADPADSTRPRRGPDNS